LKIVRRGEKLIRDLLKACAAASCILPLIVAPISADPAGGRWNILAVRVDFVPEDPDDPMTTGRGLFDLRGPGEAEGSYRKPYDTPPHDRRYFELHLEALSNYYRAVSEGKVDISFEVHPEEPDSSYHLPHPIAYYGSASGPTETTEKLVELFRDALLAADSVDGGRIDYGKFNSFIVFHAGIGREAGGKPYDIPSAYIAPEDLAGEPVTLAGGSFSVSDGCILPEAASTDGIAGLNGILAAIFGHVLGLPTLSNLTDGLPAVGGWSLMDTGAMNFGAGVMGYLPPHPIAWCKAKLGWIEPLTVTRDTTVGIAATDIAGAFPRAVKVPVNSHEYFLLENRQSRYGPDEMPRVTFSDPEDSSGVWLSADSYDSLLPGSGILIWHVDEEVIEANLASNSVNNDPFHRGIDLEEADGYDDIGNTTYGMFHPRADKINGAPSDPFYVGGTTLFSDDTIPNSRSYDGAETGIRIEVLSGQGDTMLVRISFEKSERGWPRRIPTCGRQVPPLWADIDGDGLGEIIAAGGDGIYIFRADGTPFPDEEAGPFASTGGPVITGVAACFINGSFRIAAPDSTGTLHIWGPGGEELVRAELGEMPSAGPTIADISGEASVPEVLLGIGGRVASVNLSSGDVSWLPAPAGNGSHGGIAGIAAADIDGDGRAEVIAASSEGLLFLTPEGPAGTKELWSSGGEPFSTSPVLGDIDLDGNVEAVAVTQSGTLIAVDPGSGGVLEGFPAQLSEVPGSHTPRGDGRTYAQPALGDVDGDGYLEIVIPSSELLYVVNFDGSPETESPVRLPGGPADVSGAAICALVEPNRSGMIIGAASEEVLALSGRTMLPGFPLASHGPVRVPPAAGDLDLDGSLEVVALTASGYVDVWDTGIRPGEIPWGMDGGDICRTYFHPAVPPPPPGNGTKLISHAYFYPNPVGSGPAAVRFHLSEGAEIRLRIFNSAGELVYKASKRGYPHTDNEIKWDVSKAESGLYICRLEASSGSRRESVTIKAAVAK